MIVELSIDTRRTKVTKTDNPNLNSQDKNSHNKEYPFRWTEINSLKFDDELFKKQCSELKEKVIKDNCSCTNKEIFLELINVKNNSSKTSNKEKRKIVVYSKETRNRRNKYKQLVARWKKNKTYENLSEMLTAKKNLAKI